MLSKNLLFLILSLGLLLICLWPLMGRESTPSITEQVLTDNYVRDYVDDNGVLVFNKLEEERQKHDGLGKDSANLFVYQFVTDFVSLYPLSMQDTASIWLYLQTAQVIDDHKHMIPDSVWIYSAFRDMLLTPLADSLQQLVTRKGYFASQKAPLKTWLSALATHKYYVNIRPPNWYKAWNYLLEGDFDYLWLKAQTTYKKEASLLVLAAGAVLSLIIWFIIRLRKKNIQYV